MSLINDMLRDLDARRGRPDGPDALALQGMGLVTAPMTSTLPLTRITTAVAAAAVLAIAGVSAWQYRAVTQHPVSEAAVNTVPVVQADLPLPERTLPEAPAGTASRTVPQAEPEAATAPPQTARTDESEQTAVIAAPAVEKTEVPAPETHPEPVIRKTLRQPTPMEQAEQAYREAIAALPLRPDRAMSSLEQALSLAPEHLQARMTLAGLYIREQRTDLALDLLATGFALEPRAVEQARLYGHLLLQAGRDREARTVLESAAPGAGSDAAYQALLGTLYQRLDDHIRAAEAYGRALAIDPRQGAWWLGLGMALEQLQRRDAAREAYGNALARPLATSVKTYIEQRLAALGR